MANYKIQYNLSSWSGNIATIPINSFSKNDSSTGWLPSLGNIFSIKIWFNETKKAFTERSLSQGTLALAVAIDTSYTILHFLGNIENKVLPLLTGGVLVAFELFTELRIAISLYLITRELRTNKVESSKDEINRIENLLNPDLKAGPSILHSYLPPISKCFHISIFPELRNKLDAAQAEVSTKSIESLHSFVNQNIKKTGQIVFFGITSVALTACTIFISITTLTFPGFIALTVLSIIAYAIRYYAAEKYLSVSNKEM